MVNVAVLGYGTVGSGVVEVIETNKALIEQRTGEQINIKYVLDLRDFDGDPIQEKVVHDFSVILNDPEVSVIAEAMGGMEPAYTFTRNALEAGKSVCTSNKELVAKHGAELLAVAQQHNANYLFEASVGGGIPVIRPINSSLTADEITEIRGILNGTTNYILSRMTVDGSDYDTVLAEAQNLGYAERNPEADVEGYDACRKIAILSSLAWGKQVDFEDIPTEGITEITPVDIDYASKLHGVIKLIGQSGKNDEGVYAFVAPVIISEHHQLASVNDAFNAIFIHGNMLGDAMFYGAGAGKLPTASAVAADVVDLIRHRNSHIDCIWSEDKMELTDASQNVSRFFTRLKGDKKSEVDRIFGHVTYVTSDRASDETAFLTDLMKKKDYDQKIAECGEVINMIRAEL